MTSIELKKLLLGSTLIAGFTAFMTTPSFAQDNTDDPVVEIVEDDEDEADEDDNEVIVTGSRLKKSTFNSIKPLQVIDFDETEDIGLVDTVEILQNNEAAAGVQIDSAFGGFVLDNGPGSETIDLRGLGADRTLLLVNGRRLAPLGVEGAPSQPSINTIPRIMIDNVDLLLEGASSVYGSDALAGVINVTIARDFEGLQVAASSELAEQGGEDFSVGARYGKNWDRAFFSIAGEYDKRDVVTIADRDFLADCQTNVEITETGEIRFNNVEDAVAQELFNGLRANPLDRDNPCTVGGTTSRFIEFGSPPYGSVFFNRVGANENVLGIPGYTDPFVFFSFDADGDRVIDNSLREFSINGNDNTAHLISPQERFNIFSYGEFTIDGAANVTPFYEVMYSNTQIDTDFGAAQLFPDVGADNPFNPCGVNAAIDCNLGARFNPDFSLNPEGLYNSPSYIGDFNTFQRDIDPNRDGDTRDARICATFGAQFDAEGNLIPGTGPFDNAACTPDLFGLGLSFAGPIDVLPVVTIDGDRTNNDIRLQQTRIVGGLKGDIPGSYDPDGFINLTDFNWEVSLTHNVSLGESSRPGIRDDRLNYALGNDIVTGIPIPGRQPCTGDDVVNPDVTNGCVPVNLFTPAANEIRGRLTAAEQDYLFDQRDFDTQYFQTVFSAFVAGQIADVPAGKVQASVGVEYRHDKIDSIPDNIASDGLFFGFFSDQGAAGDRGITEVFGEVAIPIVADKPFFEKLDVEAGARWLDDEFFGKHAVYTVAGGWRPFESLLIRGSYGTSFRAPNLRELFQRPQTGFTSVFDPCIAPDTAFTVPLGAPPGTPPVYDPGSDPRDPEVIARCAREGLPVDLGGGNTTQFPGVEIFNQGSLELDPEESTSLTIGASFEQPFTDRFDLSMGVNYYDIDVEQTVISPGTQFIVNDCFVIDRPSRSPFCDRIERDVDQEIEFIGLGFINRDEEEVRGLDFNGRFAMDFDIGDRSVRFRSSARANHLIERRTLFVDDVGNEIADTDDGQFGFAKWTGSLVNSIGYKDFDFNWFTRWVGGVDQDADGVDDFGNAFGIDTDDDGFADTFGDTCLGPNFGDVNCRDVGFADDYFVHNASLVYRNEDSDLRLSFGVNNVFDTEPPLVDGSEVTSLSNAPIGAGYNLNGRSFVIQARKGF